MRHIACLQVHPAITKRHPRHPRQWYSLKASRRENFGAVTCVRGYRYKMSEAFCRVLRFWIFLVGFMAVGTAVQAFMESSFLASRMYTQAQEMINAVLGRLFGTWTLLSGAVRMMCAYDLQNRAVYQLTLFSFVLAFFHFAMEYLVYETVELTFGIVSPLVISGVSIILMLQGYSYVFSDESMNRVESKKTK